MFMQTLFRNPMADSYILGVSSGSSLGVALVIMGSSFLPEFLQYFLHHPLTISLSAILGSFVVMNFILICAKRFTDTNNLLIRSEEHTSELQSRENLVCRLLLE